MKNFKKYLISCIVIIIFGLSAIGSVDTNSDVKYKSQTEIENANKKGISLYIRRKICKEMKNIFLQNGLDVDVTLKRTNEDILELQGSCINQISVDALLYSSGKEFLYNLSEMGFKKLIFSDGYNFRVSYNL